MNPEDQAIKDQEKQAEEKAQKLLTLLSDNNKVQEMRNTQRFNFETLSKPENGGITIEDCTHLADYVKIQFELAKYQKAEKLLYGLKEILISQSKDNYHLVYQVFWGLLACMIQLDKPRESTELSTVRKLKDMIKSRFSESPMGMLH